MVKPFLIYPLAVARWHSAKATLPQKVLKLKKVSQREPQRDRAPILLSAAHVGLVLT